MGQAWDKNKNENSDNTEDQKQNQNNNGNIGREEAADITQRDQNSNEIGQFGTTAERGSGSIGNSGHWDSTKENEYNAQGNTPPGNYTGNAEDNWKQGTEGSPGEGYSDAGIPASRRPGSTGITSESNPELNKPSATEQKPQNYDEYDDDDDPRNELL
ncbi:MAG TPA: hypothetical protein VGD90_07080 [Sphingobacteriaceae bacterium]